MKLSKSIKKGVNVIVLSGKYKKSIGEVLEVDRKKMKVRIKGVAIREKFILKFDPETRRMKKVHIFSESPIAWSKVMIHE